MLGEAVQLMKPGNFSKGNEADFQAEIVAMSLGADRDTCKGYVEDQGPYISAQAGTTSC